MFCIRINSEAIECTFVYTLPDHKPDGNLSWFSLATCKSGSFQLQCSVVVISAVQLIKF